MEDEPNNAPIGPDHGAREGCFCCGRRLGPRQLARHLRAYIDRMEQELANALAAELDQEDADDDAQEDPVNGAPGVPVVVNAPAEAIEQGVGDPMEDEDIAPEADGNPFGDMALGLQDYPSPPPSPRHEPIFNHEPRRNPPVILEDWPELGSDDEAEGPDDFEPVHPDDPNQDAAYDEDPQLAPDKLHQALELDLNDEEVRAALEAQLGNLAYDEWLDIYNRDLSKRDENMLRLLATRLRTHFSRQTWNELRHGICEELGIPSEFVALRRLRILSGLESVSYDMCVKSCICYLGKYKDLDACPICEESRYKSNGKPRRVFRYTPLIPQLRALFRDHEMVKLLEYRRYAETHREEGLIQDVFDGEHYIGLRTQQPHPGDEYRFFDNPEDIALGVATDGFTLFKRARSGHSTAWPILVVNYNLHPRYRTRLENLICVGVIPGPRQCKDIQSFLVPLLQELLILERGVDMIKVVSPDPDVEPIQSVFRAFLIIIFGDIPAVSKLLAMKGHNAKSPCRACYLQGVLCRLPRSSVYYMPLTHPGGEDGVRPEHLLMRTHNLFLHHYAALDAQNGYPGRRAKLAQDFGINGRPIFAHLKSFDLAACAPYDIMHLFFENLVPNMILHWIGQFKQIDQGKERYDIQAFFNDIGRLTSAATATIPSAFVGTLPDIAQDRSLYKAEAYAFWAMYIGPVVLHDRLPNKYYRHFLLMREIIMYTVQLDIRSQDVNRLETMINRWVGLYEEIYYQYAHDRLPTCPLTIHVLIHIPYYIRKTGPLCNSWAFVMERFCGYLLRAVKNHVQPYTHLDGYVQRRAQMQAVSYIYHIPILAKSTIKWTFHGCERYSSHEHVYPHFPNIILGPAVNKEVDFDTQLTNQFLKYFGVVYPNRTRQQHLDRIDTATLVRYGRFRMADDGDRVRTADSVEKGSNRPRDNSFVRFDLFPDANAAHRNLPDNPVRTTYYGQLQDIYYVEYIIDLEINLREPYLLAQIKTCKNTGGRDAALPRHPVVTYRKLSTPDVHHIQVIDAVVGRIKLNHREWAIIDRSRNGARTQFINDDDDDDDENI